MKKDMHLCYLYLGFIDNGINSKGILETGKGNLCFKMTDVKENSSASFSTRNVNRIK
jgi:hypothetical protein